MRKSARFWAYATSFGAAWGLWELTLGTFLHTLKIPLAGPILASAAAALLIAERQFFPVRGISLATGLIAAICKSISPDGTIFGPMIGILSEALLVELTLSLFPLSGSLRWLAAPLAGGLTGFFPILQKLLTQLFLYGGTIFELYLEILQKIGAGLKLQNLSMNHVAFFVGMIFVSAGALLGLTGVWIGRKGLGQLLDQWPTFDSATPLTSEQPLSAHIPETHHESKLIGVIVLLSILIQLRTGLLHASLSAALMIVVLAIFHRKALLRIFRPKFWILSLFIALLSGALLGKKDLHLGPTWAPDFSSTGLSSGALMLVRAAWILSITSWLSFVINRRVVQSLSAAFGLKHFGHAMSGVFGIMHELKPHAESLRKLSSGRLMEKLTGFLVAAARIAEQTSSQGANAGPALIAVIGGTHTGKTTTLLRLAEEFRSRGIEVGGFCQPTLQKGYELLDMSSGGRQPFATRRASGFGYHFEAKGWKWASELLNEAFDSKSVILVDELGRLEATGKGHLAVLRTLLDTPRNQKSPDLVILGVQRSFAAEIAAQLGGFDGVFSVTETTAATCTAEALLSRCRWSHSHPDTSNSD